VSTNRIVCAHLDREKLTTTTRIRNERGLTGDSYVPKSYLGNTLTILKATSKFKRSAKERRKKLQEELEERELERSGSIWSEQRKIDSAVASSATPPAAAAAAAGGANPGATGVGGGAMRGAVPSDGLLRTRSETMPSATVQQDFYVPVVQAADNSRMESQVDQLTTQVSQLHSMMVQLMDRQARLAESGGLAFRMP
jgi:hypothetical protein